MFQRFRIAPLATVASDGIEYRDKRLITEGSASTLQRTDSQGHASPRTSLGVLFTPSPATPPAVRSSLEYSPPHRGSCSRAPRPRQPSASVSPTACGAWTRPPQAPPASQSFCPRGHAAAARPSRAPPSAHAQSRAISATAPVADGVGQEGLRGQRRPHEPLEMALTCPSQPTVGAGVTTTGGAAPLHKVGITAHRKEQEAPSRGLATF